jgi:hypothetical protein
MNHLIIKYQFNFFLNGSWAIWKIGWRWRTIQTRSFNW